MQIFGREATQNPLKTFSRHFLDQTRKFISFSENLNSPFLNQMLYGSFGASAYEWMKQGALKESDIKQVNFHQALMMDYLIKASDSSFDFIHLSNILDWLSEEDASFLLRQAFRVLKRGGKVIIRQLNSSLNIKSLGEGFIWNDELSLSLTEKDKSFFYREILVGEKVQ